MDLTSALRIQRPSSVIFVGAGGKTSAIFKAGREILSKIDEKQAQKTVLISTSTHLGAWQSKFADSTVFIKQNTDVLKFESDIPQGLHLLVRKEEDHYLGGLNPDYLLKIHRLAQKYGLSLLIEGDGSHMRPLKAPAAHEPVIPDFAEQVVVVAGLQGLGKSLGEMWVHRPEVFADLSGLKIGDTITPESLLEVLLSEKGGYKNIPPEARVNALLNQADTTELREEAASIARRLLARYHSAIITSLAPPRIDLSQGDISVGDTDGEIYAVIEDVAGIILAAGGSTRMGTPKQLLEWKGEPIVVSVVRTAIDAGLSPVVVIVGAYAEEVTQSLKDMAVRIVNNESWQEGISTSIKAGIHALTKPVGGAIFLQADQPQIPSELVRYMVEAHQVTQNPIVAPKINGQRGNPVLFDASTFKHLTMLSGDVGGRALFDLYPMEWIEWNDPNLLLDIDSPGDYQKFLKIFQN